MQNNQETDQSEKPDEIGEKIVPIDLIEQLEYTVNYFHNLPKHAQFSFVTHADLHYYLIQVVNILKACVNGKF